MTTDVEKTCTTLVAGEDLTANAAMYRPIAIGGTICASNAVAVGLLRSKGKSGENVAVAHTGEMKAWAGAAISAGAKLAVTTSGFLITAVASLGATQTVGRALEAANSGDLFRGLFNFVTAN